MIKSRPTKSDLFLEHIKNYLDVDDYIEEINIFEEKVFFKPKKIKKLLLTYDEQRFFMNLKSYTKMFGLLGPYEFFEI